MTAPVGTLEYASVVPKRRGPFRKALFWVVIVLLAVFLLSLLQYRTPPSGLISLTQLSAQLASGNVSSIVLSGDEASGTFGRPVATMAGARTGSQGVNFRCQLPPGMSANWTFVQTLINSGADVRVENDQNLLLNLLLPLVPWLLIFGFIWFFVYRQLKQNRMAHGLLGPPQLAPPPAPGL